MGKQPEPNNPVPSSTGTIVMPDSGANRGLFTRQEWIAAALTFLVSGLVYFYYMSPEVTLEDSGELVTGAFNFGVPHPPGYPLWAFLGWVWARLVPFGNPAWRTCLFSVATGAALVGVMTLLMSRSILMLLRNAAWSDKLEESLKEWLSLTVGTSTAMLFAFNRGVWLWACVPEMRVLSVFLFMFISFVFFAWMMRPERIQFLYATLLLLGLSIANHQTVVVMAGPFLVGAFVVGWFADHKPGHMSGFLELVFALLVGWGVGVYVNAWLLTGPTEVLLAQKVKAMLLFGPMIEPLPLMLVAFGGAGALVVFGSQAGWLSYRRAAWCAALFLVGCSMYLYLPLASSTNPPMNWGYAATKQGFLHAVTRGQYEQLSMSSVFSTKFMLQVKLLAETMINQYSLPVAVFALVPIYVLFGQWNQTRMRARQWLIYTLVTFATTSIGLLVIINPGLDKTQQEINLKFFAPAHGFFAMLIGYGIAYVITWALARWTEVPRSAIRQASVGLVLLAIVPFRVNWATCEQRGHDFGYQFGYRMFYPGGDYPPMEKGAFLFGGTDPGRFVPTYMIFSESAVPARDKYRNPHIDNQELNFDRRDVYIVTQNALADTTYMSYIRDHYDYSRPTNYNWFARWLGREITYPRDPIYIPTNDDSQRAFQEYVADVQARQRRGEQMDAEENVDIVGGRVQVRGVKGVMNINGILCRWIHERNRDKCPFYIEESYVIPWMFEYLTPYGIIMKLNRDKVPSPQENPALWDEIVKKDTAYWDKLVAEFRTRPESRSQIIRSIEHFLGARKKSAESQSEFLRDNDAQKTFSKLRSAIGGVYSYRKMYPQALYAFRQSLELCPDSPEANFRMSQLLLETGQADEAIKVLKRYQELDPLNGKIGQAIQQITGLQQATASIQQLEQQHNAQPGDLRIVGQLAQAYLRLQRFDRVQALFEHFLAQPSVKASDMLQIAQFYLSIQQVQLATRVLELAAERFPQESDPHYALATIRGAIGDVNNGLVALRRAIELNPALRERAQGDKQLAPLRNDPRFQAMVAAPPRP